MESFVEERLDLGLLYGTNGGPMFQTAINVTDGGVETRNIDWPEELGRWDLGDKEILKPALAYLVTFFRARRGRAIGFRYKDWKDYVLPQTVIGTGDGVTKTFQIKLVADSGSGTPYTKTLTKIVGGTATAYRDGVVVNPGEYSIDIDKGRITFTVAPAVGVAVAAQCEFDTPVRFDTDHLPLRFDARRERDGQLWYYMPPLPIIELSAAEILQ